MTGLEDAVGYRFADTEKLTLALTHSSYSNEMKSRDIIMECNERLEFLGDSVLSYITSGYLYSEFPDLPEGDLSRIRAGAVCEKTLYRLADAIGLGNYLMLMRTPVLLHGSILNTLWAVVLGSLLILVSVVIGSITIEKKDIYS